MGGETEFVSLGDGPGVFEREFVFMDERSGSVERAFVFWDEESPEGNSALSCMTRGAMTHLAGHSV